MPSLLVVDDELLIRDLLYDFFNGQGWTISVADNGNKAMSIMETKQIDIVLTDIKMPGMDGLELAAWVRENHPATPVVIITGYPSVETAVSAIRTKVTDYITKPFNINQLLKTLEANIPQTKEAGKLP
jgi:YesN/AraC family two-component response regulator